MIKNDFMFASMIFNETDLFDALFQAESIRTFCGKFKTSEIVFYLPNQQTGILTDDLLAKFSDLQVQLKCFELDSTVMSFEYAPKVYAAALAEEEALNRSQFLIWTDPDNIFINQPDEFILPANAALGYRPVFQKNIGLPYNQPIKSFWLNIFQDCKTAKDCLFPMPTAVDLQEIYPYFNVGLLILRPELKMCRKWRNNFAAIFQAEKYQPYFNEKIYRVFVHQAVFTATALTYLAEFDLLCLSDRVNYSLYFHDKYCKEQKKASDNQLINLRHEWFWDNPDWQKILPADEPLKSWIIQHRIKYSV